MAESELAALSLTNGSRRFADWRILQIAEDGHPRKSRPELPIPGDLAASTVTCEVRLAGTVFCRTAGDNITQALGMSLAGRDLLAFARPADRSQRFFRYSNVAQGGFASCGAGHGIAKPPLVRLPCELFHF